MAYDVVCFTFKKGNEVVKSNLSLEEAQEICNDPDTSSRTCTSKEALALTERLGTDWFFGYRESGGKEKPIGRFSITAALAACYAYKR
jgi:hypothetical protein